MSTKFKMLTFILLSVIWINISFWAIDMDVSPIKYEIEWNKWDIIKKIAIIENNSSIDANIHLWKSNFISSDQAWVPKFLDYNDNSFPNQEIASWISINQKDFVLKAHQKKEVEFTINIPSDATPGWHYWAILFKNNNSNNSSTTVWNSVWLEVNYAVLLILNVWWELISKWTVWNPIITVVNNNWNGWLSNYIPPKKDDCPLWDLTISKYDWKCIDALYWREKQEVKMPKKDDNFEVKIEIPFKNDWNTHIKPKWKITLVDENWEVIKWIWRESKLNDNWAIIWDEVVDYIPVNDAWWNILPNSERNFDSYWKWFPYKSYDKDWNQVIKYWTPWDYYSKQNVEEWRTLMPWERVSERKVNRKIKAKVDITYKENNDNDVKYNSAKDFNVEYEEKYVWLNPYVVIPASFILFLLFIWFLIARKNKKKCIKCGKKINKKMKVCPYCEAKQD